MTNTFEVVLGQVYTIRMVSTPPTSAVLLLGEGNFSFTYSLCNRLKSLLQVHASSKGSTRESSPTKLPDTHVSTPEKIVIVTSAFDSEDEVLRKYPEMKHTISELRKLDRACEHLEIHVLYNFDATLPYIPQFLPTSASHIGAFDSIIFNFPHLGIEDAKSHGCMVAHTMHVLQAALSGKESSHFLLAIADAQWERWNIRDKADRNGMDLLQRFPFFTGDWLGYEIKRHINGKGFHNRVQECSYFCYTKKRATSCDLAKVRDDDNVILHLLRQDKNKRMDDGKELISTISSLNEAKQGKGKKKKKRKMHETTEGSWREISLSSLTLSSENAKSSTDSSMPTYECLKCLRRFTKEQAVIAHVYNVHILNSDRGSGDDDLDEVEGVQNKTSSNSKIKHERQYHQCLQCSPLRNFGSDQALQAHRSSAHGAFGIMKPKWAVSGLHDTASSEHDEEKEKNEDATFECMVCGFEFHTEGELMDHSTRGYQPYDDEDEFPCTYCAKMFTQERAMMQHMNFCQSVKVD